MKKVLIVSPLYPPGDPVGYQRVIKFEKFLPEFGYQTCILTSGTFGKLPDDAQKRVYRSFEPGQFYRPLLRRFLHRSEEPSDQEDNQQQPRYKKGVFEGTRLNKIRNGLVNRLAIPDEFIGWLPDAVRTGFQVISREQVDLIVSSSLPVTAHLVGLILSTETKKPLITDFRDGWLFEPLSPHLYNYRLRCLIERRLESWVVKGANAITTVSEPISDYFRNTYSESQQRVFTIPNGFDPEDWIHVTPAPRTPGIFRIVHTGSFSISRSTQDPSPFLQAFKKFINQVDTPIELYLVGALKPHEYEMIQSLGLSHVIHLIGQVSKTESLAYQCSADLLLLLVGKDKSVATSKLYEYLYSRKPILAISPPDTSAGRIVEDTKSGYLVYPEDQETLVSFLNNQISLWKNGNQAMNQVGIQRYHRRNLAEALSQVMDFVLQNHPMVNSGHS